MDKRVDARKQPRQARSQATVEAILVAAARVLEREGSRAFTTNRVAEAAGVSVGSLYQYFPNKEALIVALHDRHGRAMHRVIGDALADGAHATLREAVAAVVRGMLAAHADEPELHRVLEHEYASFDERTSAPDTGFDIYREVRRLLRRHAGEVRVADRELAAWAVAHTVHALVHAAVLEPPRRRRRGALEGAIVDVVLAYLTVPSASR